jgi:hypothetical protein
MQKLVAGWFKVHQSSVSRIVSWMRGVFRAVLADFIPGPDDLLAILNKLLSETERPIILLVDGTLIPVSQRKDNKADFSGKHRKTGKNIQVTTDVKGELLHVGPILPGAHHDRWCIKESGIEEVLARYSRLLKHGDKGYTGVTDFIVPHKSSKHHPLTIEQVVENLEINAIRCPVERGIAHLKVLSILRTGIRTHAVNREAVIEEIISVAIGLFFFKQSMRRS